jgi:glycosyltransferase involved in cell wall biosynthesis
MQGLRVAAVVPAYNEEETVADVVEVLRATPAVQEVIVVSDGSTDDTQQAAEEAGAHVLHLPTQHGKGGAMLHGVAHTDASVILFCDADLYGLRIEHVEDMLLPVVSGSRAMNVGLRRKHSLVDWLQPHLPLISGQRAMRRRVIEGLPPEHAQGFMIEAALNYYCRIKGWDYGTVFLSGIDIRQKYDKVDPFTATFQYIKMTFDILKAMFFVRVDYHTRRFNTFFQRLWP